MTNLEILKSQNNNKLAECKKPLIFDLLPRDLIREIIGYLDKRTANRLFFCYISYFYQKSQLEEKKIPLGKKLYSFFSKRLTSYPKLISPNLCLLPLKGYLTWGINDCGQLGLGNFDYQGTPQPLKFLDNEDITTVASGRAHTIFLTKSGEVYSCGNNQYGQLGIGNTITQSVPQKLTFLQEKKIIAIAAGENSSFFLTDKNELFSCGRNDTMKSNIRNQNNHILPQVVYTPADIRIIALAANKCHSYFITDENEIYTGFSFHDRFDQFWYYDAAKPALILPADQKVIALATGDLHILILMEDGKVYSWGSNTYGQLGLGEKPFSDSDGFVTFSPDINIINIAASKDNSFFLTHDGKVYGCGKNFSGLFGLGSSTFFECTPRLIPIPNNEKVISISAKEESALFLTENKLYCYGNGPLKGSYLTTTSHIFRTPTAIFSRNSLNPEEQKSNCVIS